MTARQLAEEAGELREFDAALIAEEKKIKRMAVGMARTRADLEEIAKERGYKPSWVKIQARLKQGGSHER
jgi:hypothetical protein